MIRHIEELALNAWPALQTVVYDGWIMRFANGFTRRANSVNPLYPSTLEPQEKIRYCGEIYSAKGQDTVFKLTSAVFPGDLDSILAERGYVIDAPTNVQQLNLEHFVPARSEKVKVATSLDDPWLDDFCRLSSRASSYKPLIGQLLKNIASPMCFVCLKDQQETVALGMGVLERDYIGLYDIVTAESHRNQGLGTLLVKALLNWGQANGATSAYLQVMANNAPALRLYEKMGFQENYRYWYRMKQRGQ